MSPVIFLSDDDKFDLEDAADALTRWVGRLIVEAKLDEPLVERLVELTARVDVATVDLRGIVETLTQKRVE